MNNKDKVKLLTNKVWEELQMFNGMDDVRKSDVKTWAKEFIDNNKSVELDTIDKGDFFEWWDN